MNAAERTAHEALLRDSFQRVVGRELHPSADDLFAAPFIVCSHNTDRDPIFTYGNQAALDLFELDWTAFTQLPSRLSAEPVHQSERRRLLDAVAQKGFIENYGGVRVSSSGQRFQVTGATVWNIIDEQGHLRGQAATFAMPTPIEDVVVPPKQGLPRSIHCRYCDIPMVRRRLLSTEGGGGGMFGSKPKKIFSGIFTPLDEQGYEVDEPMLTLQVHRCPICYYTELFSPPIKSGYSES